MAKTKAFKITQNNQYIQEINLNAGEYTFSANIRADSASITVCKFSLLVGGVWLEYDLTDQIYIGQFQKVKKVIQLNDKATKLSLISSGSGGGRIFHVDRPMFEEGSNAGTPKPNELDIEEQAEASNVKITIGIPYYEFRKDADGGTVQETLTIPFHIFKGNQKVSVPSANIGVLYKPTNVMVVDVSNAFNSIYVIPLKEFTASEGRVVFSIPVDGRNYETEFQFKVKEAKDGKDGTDGTDGTDGENAKWVKLNSTATQIKVGKDNVATPTSLTVFSQLYNITGTVTWNYSIDGANFSSTLPTGVTRSGNEVTIDSSTSTFKVLTIRAAIAGIYDTITISRVVDGKDGDRGVPGKSPVTKEYRVGQTYYNNDVAIHYVYYRDGNSWWKLKDSVESHTASTSSPNTVYFEQLSSVEVMVAETIIAENANLAEFIFKNKTLFSQQGTNSAGDSIKFGEYVQFQFGIYNSTTPPASNWSGWNDTPPTTTGNYLWIRYKITSESVWAVKRVTGTDPDFTVQFGATKDDTFYNIPYQAGRNWMKMSDGRLYAITEELALADYDPNLWMGGTTGKFKGVDVEIQGRISAGALGTARVEMNEAGLEIFNALNTMNIRFGLKNGYAVMEYYDNDGKFLYDLGPNGIGEIEVREESWTEVRLHLLSTSLLESGYIEALSKTEIYKNGASNPTTYYRYNSKIVAGVYQDPTNNGKIFPSRDKTGIAIKGIFCRATNGYFRGIAGGAYPTDYHPNNPTIYWTSLYNVWQQPLIEYMGGVIQGERYSAYWTIIREGYGEI